MAKLEWFTKNKLIIIIFVLLGIGLMGVAVNTMHEVYAWIGLFLCIVPIFLSAMIKFVKHGGWTSLIIFLFLLLSLFLIKKSMEMGKDGFMAMLSMIGLVVVGAGTLLGVGFILYKIVKLLVKIYKKLDRWADKK